MTDRLDTINYRIKQPGEHKGKLITRAPLFYLKWLVNNKLPEAPYASAELERRGIIKPELDLTGHSVDRASQVCWRIWKRTRNEGEGLYAWLARVAAEAIRHGKKRKDVIVYLGMQFVFELEHEWPVLKTVMRDDHKIPPRPPRFRDLDDEEADATT